MYLKTRECGSHVISCVFAFAGWYSSKFAVTSREKGSLRTGHSKRNLHFWFAVVSGQ